MSEEEYNKTSENRFNFDRGRTKFLGTKNFVKNRVIDGKFNCSKLYPGNYRYLVKILVNADDFWLLDKKPGCRTEYFLKLKHDDKIDYKIKKLGLLDKEKMEAEQL